MDEIRSSLFNRLMGGVTQGRIRIPSTPHDSVFYNMMRIREPVMVTWDGGLTRHAATGIAWDDLFHNASVSFERDSMGDMVIVDEVAEFNPGQWSEIRTELADRATVEMNRRTMRALGFEPEEKTDGKDVLLSHLTDAQKESMAAHNWFIAIGSRTGREFRIEKDTQFNVTMYDGNLVTRLCCVPDRAQPVYDIMLTQKLWIEVDEIAFLKKANFSPPRLRHDDSRVYIYARNPGRSLQWVNMNTRHAARNRFTVLQHYGQLYGTRRPTVILLDEICDLQLADELYRVEAECFDRRMRRVSFTKYVRPESPWHADYYDIGALG